jgi:CHAT domain-containing protein
LSEYQQAADYYDKALLLIRSSGEQTSEARRTEADVLVNICTVSTRLGEMQRALDACTQGQSLFRQLNHRESEGLGLNRMALVLNHLGEYEKSLELNDESLRLLRLVGSRRQEAITLNDLGLTHVNLGNYSKAVEYYRQSLILAKEVKNRGGQLVTLHNLGVGYFLLGDKDHALDSFTQALALARESGDREAEAKTLMSLGRLSQLSADLSHAIDFYQQALQLARAIKAAPQEAYVLFYLAQAKREQGNLTEALARSAEALNITESLRTKVTSPELRSSFFASIKDRYDFYIDLLMQMHQQRPDEGRAALALQASERARARSLLELLAEARTDIRQGADPALLQKERSLQQQLNDKEQARVQLLSRKHTPEQAEAAEREIRALTTQSQELRLQVRARNPHYAGLTQPQALTVAEIQRQVLDKDTLLLEYSLGEKRSFLWAVTPDSTLSYQLPPRAEIEAAARRVYELLVARQPAPELTEAQQMARGVESDAQYQVQAAALSRMLLGPVAAQLGTKRLLIVADGALQYLPFAALPTPGEDSEAGQRGRATTSNNSKDLRIPLSRPSLATFTPLIVEHEIVSLPSASVMAVLRRELAGRQPAARMVAVLADPVFEPDDARLKLSLASRKSPRAVQPPNTDTTPLASVSAASLPLERAIRSVKGGGVRAGLRRLLFSRDEAEAILTGIPQPSGLKALDFQANRRLVMSDELSQYRIIHFATHGLLDSQHPELSGLVLSLVDEAGEAQEGFLRLHEIYNLRLNADLVVLSACQTGLGKEVRGEGLIGMTRGFMYAGAKRVVASLWQVDDAATAQLMKRFYRGMMQEKLPPAAALRAAQIEMMKKKHWQSPYYWGAFVLQGEWR